MLLLYVSIGVFLVIGFGSAIYMGKRFKKTVEAVPTPIVTNQVNLEPVVRLLAQELGKQFAKEMKEVLKELQLTQPVYMPSSMHVNKNDKDEFEITIDDRLIPVTLNPEQVEANVSFKNKTEAVDTGLNESKNKLASLLKKKKEK